MQRDVDLIFGQTGSGKTHTARGVFAQTPRAIVAESNFGEFPALVFADLPALVDHLERIGAFDNKFVPFRVSYSPRDEEEFDVLCELALELGNVKLFVEEADRFRETKKIYHFNEIITRGRHFGVGVVAISLHPFLIPIDLRRQCTRLVTFRQTEPDDIKWLRDLVGDSALELPNLPGPPGAPPFPFLEWTPGTPARIVFPDGRTRSLKNNT